MSSIFYKDLRDIAALVALSALLFGVFLGQAGLMDPDEPFYALSAKEMVEAKDPWTPRMFGEGQFEKPIFFYWVLYLSFKIFGIHEWSARLGPCIAGILTVLVAYFWGRVLFERRRPAIYSAVILATAGQMIVLSRVVLTDIFFCLFVSSALAIFTWGKKNERWRLFAWHLFFVFLGLAFLTKGPLGVLIPLFGIVSYALFMDKRWILKAIPWKKGFLIFAAVGLPWYVMMTKIHGPSFLSQTFFHENIRRFFVAEHKGMDSWLFYPLVFSLGFVPWTGLAFSAIRDGARNQKYLLLCFWVPVIFFMLAKSKLMSYIFPVYPIAALLTGFWFYRIERAWGMGFRSRPSLIGIQALSWVIAPIVIAYGAYRYATGSGIALEAPILTIAALWIPITWGAFYFFTRRQAVAAFAMAAAGMVLFSTLAFGWMMPKGDEAFSTKTWAEDIRRTTADRPGSLFLVSKMFVRGVVFYTGKEPVGVFSSRANGDFYTAHPITIVSDVKEFLRTSSSSLPLYLFLRPKEFKHLMSGLTPGFKASILQEGPQRMIVRLERA